ncbi:aminotransferase class V-fold PLP-dependent enzyme [Maledivibacter halophilus]|uniref:L-seryl-tRNA(Ser) seleniumtransferase n=1 Tax=Maledivibacter halophilus TaxID=36842 RepID=A0A1T5MDZ4_9FIRM|nr:aminotransferase class V-fold PLP-dependent enzyme [Maledivibacter halophilus]SKC86303.1 L-seryl-tRNA(Ser) seleniumtransferase [Maledivibacter halophilus]
MEKRKDIYDRLGVKKFINAAGTYTAIGGSRMSKKTLEDIADAAASHVEIRELQKNIHEKLAELTKNEGAYICNGAAAGLYLSIAACIASKEGKAFNYIPIAKIMEKEVVTFSAHRNPYDWSIKQLGAKIIQIGFPNIILPATAEDLENAITDNTVAVYYAAGSEDGWIPKGALSFEATVKVAKERNIPVIVDSAAQLPPVENLWNYTKQGADIAIFSGGKDLRGPQSSGLIVGRKKLIDIITKIGFPNYGIGRMLKVGREEIIGLFSAVEQFVNMDHEKRRNWCEDEIKRLQEAFNRSNLFKIDRTYPNEAGQPIPRAFVNIIDNNRLKAKKLQELLMEGEYGIYTNSEDRNGVYINPMTLQEGEMNIIIDRLKEIEG